jgi:hypothetical protein
MLTASAPTLTPMFRSGLSGGEEQDSVAVFPHDAKLIGRIVLPERSANLCSAALSEPPLHGGEPVDLLALC